MIKKNIFLILTFCILIIAFIGCIDSNNQNDVIIIKSDGSGSYPRIQDAIDQCKINDIIYIKNGVYQENLIINKTITLIGDSAKSTIIDAENSGHGIIINADNVTIKSLTIRNSGTISTYYEMDGAITINANNTLIQHCICENSYAGLQMKYAKNNTVDRTIIRNNSHGIFLYFSLSNIISNNTIEDNYDYGCYLYSDANNNIIRDNKFTLSRYSLRVKSRYNTIYKNRFIDNKYGVYFCCGSKGNLVYANVFINNTGYNAKDNFNENRWYDVSFGGNFWDDYQGIDENNDGFGDTEYLVDEGKTSQEIAIDKYPFINWPK